MFDTKMENVGQAVVDAIMTSGNYKSKAEIRRLMKQGAIRINGERVTDIATIQSVSSDAVIQVGKGKFYKLNTEDKKKDKAKKQDFLSSLKVDVNQQPVVKNLEEKSSLDRAKKRQEIEK